MREINEVIIHCSATEPSWMEGHTPMEKTAEIKRWHVAERGWQDIGYHYVIDRNGVVTKGRDDKIAGAHVKGHNANSIGICLIGGKNSDRFQDIKENFTLAQERSLISLITDMRLRYPDIVVSGHNQYSSKACPGFQVPKWVVERWDIPTRTHSNVSQPVPKGRKKKGQSGTVKAALVTAASGAGSAVTAVTNMEGPAQLMLIGIGGLVIILALYILRERLKAWAEGWT